MMIKYHRRFTSNSNDILSFSPYVRIILSAENKLYVERTDTHMYVVISTDSTDVLHELTQVLKNGIQVKELENFLRQNGVREYGKWISLCIEKGVIE